MGLSDTKYSKMKNRADGTTGLGGGGPPKTSPCPVTPLSPPSFGIKPDGETKHREVFVRRLILVGLVAAPLSLFHGRAVGGLPRPPSPCDSLARPRCPTFIPSDLFLDVNAVNTGASNNVNSLVAGSP